MLSHQFVLAAGDLTAPQRQSTSWSYADPEGAWRATAGDLISGSLEWSRSTRLGGRSSTTISACAPIW